MEFSVLSQIHDLSFAFWWVMCLVGSSSEVFLWVTLRLIIEFLCMSFFV